MVELTTRAAQAADFDFCWDIYSASVSPRISRHLRTGWDQKAERAKFQKAWSANDAHIVLYSGQPVGWFGVRTEANTVVVQHGVPSAGLPTKEDRDDTSKFHI